MDDPVTVITTMDDTKALKEEFVSNTTGTVPMEIFLIAIITLSSFACYALLRIYFKYSKYEHYMCKYGFVIENISIVFPILLSFTLLSSDLISVACFLFAIMLIISYRFCNPMFKQFTINFWNCKVGDTQQSYLTNYKATIQITTAICILAVDFNIFPRRFAKVEVYGIGVMDMAVGTIIFSRALTSRQARTQDKVNLISLFKNLRKSSLLLGLGIIRTVIIKCIGYQEHVSEYGSHWNFFLTIGMVQPIANLILFITKCNMQQPLLLFLSLISIITYQWLLSMHGLESIIQNGFSGDKDSRINIIDANREGIFSCFGYLSIYFCGLFFGRQLFKKSHCLYNKLFWLLCWFVTGYFCMAMCVIHITPLSRQMANISYFFIQIAFNSLLLSGFVFIDMICYAMQNLRKKTRNIEQCIVPISFLSQAISQNLLAYFLLANVFTGLVNLSIDTLQCTDFKSMCFLTSYMFILNNIIWNVFMLNNPWKKYSSD